MCMHCFVIHTVCTLNAHSTQEKMLTACSMHKSWTISNYMCIWMYCVHVVIVHSSNETDVLQCQ